jgi:hypothetical protein
MQNSLIILNLKTILFVVHYRSNKTGLDLYGFEDIRTCTMYGYSYFNVYKINKKMY